MHSQDKKPNREEVRRPTIRKGVLEGSQPRFNLNLKSTRCIGIRSHEIRHVPKGATPKKQGILIGRPVLLRHYHQELLQQRPIL
jgi:hypothetical protein